ncbi:VOC family protein [Neobacillus sp. PS3-34]|uniref:VOC family protein n=1 Tax=Neobacillus sp. PS3-34 TaxID=3070678 RepID=UPI0027E0FDB4|nr:VOC family protein [Neobacillus sp. PS3-34]WML49504.1 VOC family protein [Neobacillus sp. PS3-34]
MKNANLYETHILTKNLERAIEFYKGLDLNLAFVIEERRVAFFWLGDPEKKEQMLGIWEVAEDKFVNRHFAFHVSLEELLEVPVFLESKGIKILPAFGLDESEPVVHAWMPAAAYYFEDHDGNSLEYLALVDGQKKPEVGVVHLSKWQQISQEAANTR